MDSTAWGVLATTSVPMDIDGVEKILLIDTEAPHQAEVAPTLFPQILTTGATALIRSAEAVPLLYSTKQPLLVATAVVQFSSN